MSNGFCAPTVVYLVFAIFGIAAHTLKLVVHPNPKVTIGNTQYNKSSGALVSLLMSALITGCVTWILYSLCANGHEGWAWTILVFLVFLLPMLVVIVMIAVVFHLGHANDVSKESFQTCTACM